MKEKQENSVIHILPTTKGWRVKESNNKRAHSVESSFSDAFKTAFNIEKQKNRNNDIYVHNTDGRIMSIIHPDSNSSEVITLDKEKINNSLEISKVLEMLKEYSFKINSIIDESNLTKNNQKLKKEIIMDKEFQKFSQKLYMILKETSYNEIFNNYEYMNVLAKILLFNKKLKDFNENIKKISSKIDKNKELKSSIEKINEITKSLRENESIEKFNEKIKTGNYIEFINTVNDHKKTQTFFINKKGIPVSVNKTEVKV